MGRTEKALRAWHASPYNFDEFRHPNEVAKTGEGATVYGHGLYVAESPKVSGPGLSQYMSSFQDHPATVGLGGWTIPDDFGGVNDRLTLDDSYADGAHPSMAPDDEFGQNWVNHFLFERHRDPGALKRLVGEIKDRDNRSLADFMGSAMDITLGTDEGGDDNGYSISHAQAVRDYLEGFGKRPGAIFQKPEDYYQHINKDGTGGPFSYEVNVHLKPETLLDWDTSVKDQHPEATGKIAGILGLPKDKLNHYVATMDMSGQALYSNLINKHGSDIAASEALYNAGIHGIRYEDAGSRNLIPTVKIDGSTVAIDRDSGHGHGAREFARYIADNRINDLDEAMQKLRAGAAALPGGSAEDVLRWAQENQHKIRVFPRKPTYNYVIFHPDLVEAIAQYDIKGEKVRDMGPGVHLKAVDHDPFKGEK